MRALSIVAGLAMATWLAGCSDHHGNVDTEGCEHLKEGPPAPVTAAATAAQAPAINNDHKRYDVALIAVTGGNGGFVSFAPAEATDYIFFLSADVPVAITDGAGTNVPIEESAKSSTVCTEIKGRHVVELAVGTYALRLGPTVEGSVGIVVEEARGHPH